MDQSSISLPFHTIYNFSREKLGFRGGVGRGGRNLRAPLTCLKHCLLKCDLVVEILEGG